MRAGTYYQQPDGHKAFIPKPLPPDPKLHIDEEMLALQSSADLALGRLDGLAMTLPNPDLFVAMYVRKEAVISSQIEGTQASLVDVLEYEAWERGRKSLYDAREVINYIDAMNYGLQRLSNLPLSNRLIREIHEKLVADVRGTEWAPGQFRRRQNWIGLRPDAPINEALFIPPPPDEAQIAMGDLEKYLHGDRRMPILIECGLVHSQFETIHPFLDGNGRLGRLLITFMLCHAEVLRRPLLYLSAYFKKHRAEYYDYLQNVRDKGNWEGWIKFFLRGVWQVADEATETAEQILSMQKFHHELIQEKVPGPANGIRLLELLHMTPVISVSQISDTLDIVYPTANRLVLEFQKLGLLEEITGQSRYRLFAYSPYLGLLRKDTEVYPEGD